MKFCKVSLALSFILISVGLHAQVYWMQPLDFFVKPGGKTRISFVGDESFMGVPWELKASRVAKLDHHTTSAQQDIRPLFKEGKKDHIEISFQQEGTQLIVMQSNATFREVAADTFNTYIKENGLDEAYFKREQANTLTKPAHENYTQYIKLLLQVGEKYDDTSVKNSGLPVEIIPITNPYSLKTGDVMKFRILFRGKPVFGARVKVWNRKDNRTTLQNIYTEKDGTMETRMSNSGSWMVSVVHMVLSTDKRADWQSYRCSLVFGVKE